MPLWNGSNPPKELKGKQKRNVVKTPVGYVRISKHDGSANEELIRMNNPTLGTSVITDMWFADAAYTQQYQLTHGVPVNIMVSFDQPIQNLGGAMQVSVANTNSTATAGIAKSTTTPVVEGNKIKFTFTPATTGSYKVAAQTIANASSTAISLRTTAKNGNTAVSLVFSGTAGPITAS